VVAGAGAAGVVVAAGAGAGAAGAAGAVGTAGAVVAGGATGAGTPAGGVVIGSDNGVAVIGAAGVWMARSMSEPPEVPRRAYNTARISVVASMKQAHQIVIRTRAVVVPAPNMVSVIPPPKAAPTPWSFDFCIKISTINSSATIT